MIRNHDRGLWSISCDKCRISFTMKRISKANIIHHLKESYKWSISKNVQLCNKCKENPIPFVINKNRLTENR